MKKGYVIKDGIIRECNLIGNPVKITKSYGFVVGTYETKEQKIEIINRDSVPVSSVYNTILEAEVAMLREKISNIEIKNITSASTNNCSLVFNIPPKKKEPNFWSFFS